MKKRVLGTRLSTLKDLKTIFLGPFIVQWSQTQVKIDQTDFSLKQQKVKNSDVTHELVLTKFFDLLSVVLVYTQMQPLKVCGDPHHTSLTKSTRSKIKDPKESKFAANEKFQSDMASSQDMIT